jgi:hypothetical protein
MRRLRRKGRSPELLAWPTLPSMAIPPRDSGGGRCEQARSRGALRTRVLRQERKLLMFRLQIKKGGGAPEGANRIGRTTRTDVATCPRHGRGARHGRSAYTNHPLRARSPFGAPPRLWPRFLGLGFRLQARFPGTRQFAGVTRPRLSQSSGSTPRAGRNTGGHDARSRPGAVCETARGYRPRSTFRIASRKRPC